MGGMGEEEVDFEKYSSSTTPILETEKQKMDLESCVDPSRLLDPTLEKQRQEYTRRSWFKRNTSAPDAASTSDDDSDDNKNNAPDLPGEDTIAVGYSKVQIIAPKDALRSESPVYSTPVKATGHIKKSVTRKETVQETGHMSPSLSWKPLPPPPPKKPPGLFSGSTNKGESPNMLLQAQESTYEDGGGMETENGGFCKEETGRGYANFSVLKLGSQEKRERSTSNPLLAKKPKPLPRKAGTLDRIDFTDLDRGFGCSLPADFKPIPPPRKPTPSSPSQSPKFSSRPPKPPLLPKPSPPFTRAHPPLPPSQSTSDTVDEDTVESAESLSPTTSPSKSSEIGNVKSVPQSDGNQPVAPPRRKRKAKVTPTRQPLSPVSSPSHGSPDAGSSDHPDTSSESDLSHPHSKLLPSPSPVPRSPSPLNTTLPPEWHEEESQNSSLMVQCHSIPSVRSSFPASPLNLPSTYGYVGDREPLPPITPFSTLNQQPLLPTSSEHTVIYMYIVPLYMYTIRHT